MSLRNCLPDLLAEGRISRETADAVGMMFDDLAKEYRKNFGADAADAMAGEEALKAMEREALLKRRQQVGQILAQERIRTQKPGPKLYEDLDIHRQVVRSRALAQMEGILSKHRHNLAGEVRKKSDLDLVVRELFGENTGDLNARELADSFTGTAEWLRQRFNAAGGHIGKIDRWGLPQSHDSRAIREASFEQWRDFTVPKLDRDRMIDERTDQPYTDTALDTALRDVWETIRTEGWSKRKVGAGFGKSLANRHSESRFLHFATADDWLAYSERFGIRAPFDAMIGHVEAMSRDIAAMEVLGPNPTATVRWHKDLLEKEAALDTAAGNSGREIAFKQGKQIERLWNEYSGANRRPESRRLALNFGAYRAIQTSAKLGSATLSATTDVGFQAVTRHYNGLPVAKTIAEYVRHLNPANAADRRFATRAGIIAETWTTVAAGQHRYLTEELVGEKSRRLADGVLRLSGLNAWTDAGRWAFGMDALGHITEMRHKTFDKLDPALSSAMARNGITPSDWDAIRSAPLEKHRNVGWILPQNIEDGAASDKLLAWILKETDYAVPTPNLKTRAWINSLAPSGTWGGELIKSMFQFKSFSIALVLMQGARFLETHGAWSRAKYAAGFLLGMTAMGALVAQLKEIASGRDPMPMETPEFWGKAILQGGGLGIFGDFIAATENRFGGGLPETVAGPMVQTVGDVGNATLGNLWKVFGGKETDFGKDAFRLGRQHLPGGSLWYLKLGFDRIAADELQQTMDPNYAQSWDRMLQRADDQGQGFWWEMGDDAPDRAPDFGNVFAEEGAEAEISAIP